MLKDLASDLYSVKTQEDAQIWIQRLFYWRVTFKEFLSEMTRDSNDSLRATHERLLKAYNSLVVLINTETMFRYLDETLVLDKECPRTNNPIEDRVSAQLRRLLRYHRGMSVEKRIKAVFWWCYLHSPRPLSTKEILEVMPTDASISKIYRSMNERALLQDIISTRGMPFLGVICITMTNSLSMIWIKVPTHFFLHPKPNQSKVFYFIPKSISIILNIEITI